MNQTNRCGHIHLPFDLEPGFVSSIRLNKNVLHTLERFGVGNRQTQHLTGGAKDVELIDQELRFIQRSRIPGIGFSAIIENIGFNRPMESWTTITLRKLFKTPIFERWGKQFCLN